MDMYLDNSTVRSSGKQQTGKLLFCDGVVGVSCLALPEKHFLEGQPNKGKAVKRLGALVWGLRDCSLETQIQEEPQMHALKRGKGLGFLRQNAELRGGLQELF